MFSELFCTRTSDTKHVSFCFVFTTHNNQFSNSLDTNGVS